MKIEFIPPENSDNISHHTIEFPELELSTPLYEMDYKTPEQILNEYESLSFFYRTLYDIMMTVSDFSETVSIWLYDKAVNMRENKTK